MSALHRRLASDGVRAMPAGLFFSFVFAIALIKVGRRVPSPPSQNHPGSVHALGFAKSH